MYDDIVVVFNQESRKYERNVKNYLNVHSLICRVNTCCKMCIKIFQMRLFVYVFLALTTIKCEDIPGVTLISQKIRYGSKYRMTCVVSGNSTDSAIIWNQALPSVGNDIINSVSEYVPSRNNSYNCNIEVGDETCNKYWAGKNGWLRQRSFYSRLSPVTDHRWEGFTTHYTSNSAEMKTIAVISHPNFTVHISIRIKEEANIYLCDNENQFQANCYWILLEGRNPESNAMKMCTNGTVPKKENAYPKEECQILTGGILRGAYDPLLSDMEWRHFTIEKEGNSILVWQIGKNIPILNYTNVQTRLFNMKYLSIRSDGSPGFWKLHEYAYSFTNNETISVFGPRIEITQSNFCMALFVAMCSHCNLKLEVIYNHTTQDEIIKTFIITPIKGMVWQEEKLILSLSDIPINIQLRVHSLCPTGNCDYPFWAIDNFQICSEKEIRVLPIEQDKDKASCQLIKYPHWRLSQSDVLPYNLSETKCFGGTFSESCTECSIVLGHNKPNCDNSIICEMQTNEQSICRCATGYTGVACDSSLAKVEVLRVITKDATSITVSWKPPQATTYGKIKHYNIRYKHVKYMACETEQDVNKDSKGFIRAENTTVKISKLRPYSDYLIEVSAVSVIYGIPSTIIASTLQTGSPEQSEIPTIKAVEPRSTTVKITLQQPNCTIIKGPIVYYLSTECSNSWCLQDAKDVTYIDKAGPLILTGLQAFSNYTVKINVGRKDGNRFNGHIITETFHTNVSLPNIVTNLTAYSKNKSSVSLRFLPPYPPNGEIENYYMRYLAITSSMPVKNDDYKYKEFHPNECKLWRNFHCVTLQKLEMDTKYEISVYAKNMGTAYNTPANLYVQTTQEQPGTLENLTSKWDSYHNLTLTWGHPSITNGPLTKFIVTISNSEHDVCYNKSIPIAEEHYNNIYYHVIPLETCYSSNLSIQVAACNIDRGLPIIQNVFSPPQIPSFDKLPFVETFTNTTVTINVPSPKDLANNSVMYVIVSNTNSPSNVTNNTETMLEVWDKLNVPNNALSWIAAEYDFTKVKPVPQVLVIGNGTKSMSTRLNKELYNQILYTTNTSYTISIAIINEYGGFKRYSVFTIEASYTTQSDELNQSSNYGLFALLLLLLLPIILWIFIRRRRGCKAYWVSRLNMNRTVERNTRNPDIIPLTTVAEKNTGKIATQFQLRLKRKLPINEDADVAQSTASHINKQFSRPVKIIEFEKYVKESIENGELQRQRQLLPRGQTKPWDYGLLPQNKSKNRYNNLVAYDYTRVKLTKINKDPYSDYINANYIEGYNTKKTYIATQGPKSTTVHDFWRMIWQENVKYIIMLANIIEGGKNKIEQYWPNVNEHLEFGNIKVEYLSSRAFADYECRKFSVSSNKDERRVEQLHFTSWPDHGIPLYSHKLVPLLRKILTIPQGSVPIVVHCSAGVGRTGTIILCDLCLRMAAREGVVDILKHQYNLREQRVNLVDNIEQYKLVHLVLLECLVAPQTNISCDEEMESVILRLLESGRVTQQMLYLHETSWQDQVMRPPFEAAPNPEWSTKNRFQDIIPWGHGHVKLSPYPVTVEHSDYINAVDVDGFRSPRRFIVTQQPLPHTISDFWRMIQEKEVTTIVSLNQINFEDETSCVFWPTESDTETQPVPFLTLQFQNNSNSDYYSVVTLHLCSTNEEETTKRTVKLIILKGWPAKKVLPDEEESLLKLWDETERVSGKSNRIVVTCYDGAKASGLFIALSIVIEKMKFEQECDVCSAVRTVRHNRKQFVAEIDQFFFLYRAAIKYLRCFDLYSNITPK